MECKPSIGETAVSVRELTKLFPVRRGWAELIRRPAHFRWTPALQGINFTVDRGEVFGLLGSNGAGKTTLLRILATLLLPSDGRAEVAGHDVVKSSREARRAVGWSLDSDRSFYYRLTGIQNLSFFSSLNNLTSSQSALRIKKILEILDLGDVVHQPFMTYSWGARQKLGLARALLTDPAILLLDEPTKSLDPASAAEFRLFLRNVLARELGKTVLIVSHNIDEAKFCCDRIAVMQKGRISSIGTWSEVESHLRLLGFTGPTLDS